MNITAIPPLRVGPTWENGGTTKKRLPRCANTVIGSLAAAKERPMGNGTRLPAPKSTDGGV